MTVDVNKTTGRVYVTDGILERLQWFDPSK